MSKKQDNDTEKVCGARWPISCVAERWSKAVDGDAETIAAILYFHVRGDFVETDANLARFLSPIGESIPDIPKKDCRENSYYLDAAKRKSSEYDPDITLGQIGELCVTHKITPPTFLEHSLAKIRGQARATAAKQASPKARTIKATQAKITNKQLRLDRLDGFLNKVEKQFRQEGYKPFDRREIGFTKADFHKVFFRQNSDISHVSIATLADDVHKIGARFAHGTRRNKKNLLAQLFAERKLM